MEFLIVINSSSGSDSSNEAHQRIKELFEQAGKKAEFFPLEGAQNGALEKAVVTAKQQKAVVVAAGGDGTVNLVAGFCHRHDVTMGIIPLGTFNHVAKGHGIAMDLPGAMDVLLSGSPKTIPAGMVGDKLFFNNASFGLYTTLIQNREDDTLRFGRYRIVAIISAVRTLFGKRRIMTLNFKNDSGTVLHRAIMVFVGNNPLQLENVGLEKAAESATNFKLGVVLIKPLSRMRIITLLFGGLTRGLSYHEDVEEYTADRFEIHTRRRHIYTVVDGEIFKLFSPLAFCVMPEAVQLLCPKDNA